MTTNLDLVPIAKGGKFVKADFLIARRAVTVFEFQDVGGERAESAGAGAAVKLATSDEAIHYYNLLSRKAGRPPACDEATGVLLDRDGTPARDIADVAGFRLTTGMEWDYAARGGRPDPPYADWGAVLDRMYWDDPTSHGARPVALSEPVTNVIGLVSMLGFVREWYSHFAPAEDSRNRVCGWSHHYTNYDCFIAYHVDIETAAAGATFPFRIAWSADAGRG